jgi:8-oxo-dGTP pyrophosphatase MutT (NUDIX family)
VRGRKKVVMKEAVLALIKKGDLFLALPHRVTGKIGLPGGKVDNEETLKEALKRECLEEAGIHINTCHLIFSELAEDYLTYTFVCNFSGVPTKGDTGQPIWATKEELIGDRARFPDYNLHLFESAC